MPVMTEIALTCDSEIRRGHPQRHRPDAAAPPLRLTRRGRIVIAVAAALLVPVISLLAAGVAQATSHGPSPRAARHIFSRSSSGPARPCGRSPRAQTLTRTPAWSSGRSSTSIR